MEAIKETIKNVIDNLQNKNKQFSGDNPESLLKKILSKEQLSHIRFGYFRKGILGVKVDSSSWLYFLNLQKLKLLGKLQRKSKTVKDIHFSIGDFENKKIACGDDFYRRS